MTDQSEQTARAARPPKPSKGERTRARVLDAAAELFSGSGFHAVSLRDIAARAGMTHAGLLHHFPGKEALLIEVLGRRDREDAHVMFRLDPDTEPKEFLAQLVGIAHRNMNTPGLVGLYAKLSAEASDPEHPAHRYFIERYRLLRDRLGRAFAALAARTDPPGDYDPALAAQMLLAQMDGLQTQWLLEPETVDMRSALVAFFARLGLDFSDEPAFPNPHPGGPPETSDHP